MIDRFHSGSSNICSGYNPSIYPGPIGRDLISKYKIEKGQLINLLLIGLKEIWIENDMKAEEEVARYIPSILEELKRDGIIDDNQKVIKRPMNMPKEKKVKQKRRN